MKKSKKLFASFKILRGTLDKKRKDSSYNIA